MSGRKHWLVALAVASLVATTLVVTPVDAKGLPDAPATADAAAASDVAGDGSVDDPLDPGDNGT